MLTHSMLLAVAVTLQSTPEDSADGNCHHPSAQQHHSHVSMDKDSQGLKPISDSCGLWRLHRGHSASKQDMSYISLSRLQRAA